MRHHATHTAPAGDARTVMVFIRDLEHDIGTGYKTKIGWGPSGPDCGPWSEGAQRCDCVRGPIVYGAGEYSCGTARFVVERIVLWDTGETVYSETDPA